MFAFENIPGILLSFGRPLRLHHLQVFVQQVHVLQGGSGLPFSGRQDQGVPNDQQEPGTCDSVNFWMQARI